MATKAGPAGINPTATAPAVKPEASKTTVAAPAAPATIAAAQAEPVQAKPEPAIKAEAPKPAPAPAPAPLTVKAPVAAPAPVKAPVAVKPLVKAKALAKVKKAIVRKAGRPAAAAKPAKVLKAAKAAVSPATRPVVANVQKEVETMATKFETPKMMTDMNDRAKAAMEKSGKLVSEFTDFNKGNVEAVVESTRITAKGLEVLGQNAADYSRKSFEGLTATLKTLASVKSPTEFFKVQSDYVRSQFDSAIAEASKSTEAMIKLAGDAAQPISNRFAVAAEKVKTAA